MQTLSLSKEEYEVALIWGGSAFLKGKLVSLEETVKDRTTESMQIQLQGLKTEKVTLEIILNSKIDDIRKGRVSEVGKVEHEMKTYFEHQRK